MSVHLTGIGVLRQARKMDAMVDNERSLAITYGLNEIILVTQ